MSKTITIRGLKFIFDDNFDPSGLRLCVDRYGYCNTRSKTNKTGKNGRAKYTSTGVHRYIIGANAGQIVDHINGDRLDNRRENLRTATPSQSGINRKFKGYTLHKQTGKYQVVLQYKGKSHYIGLFKTEEIAKSAYIDAAKRIFGDDAAYLRKEIQP
jgi:hypothetical protein